MLIQHCLILKNDKDMINLVLSKKFTNNAINIVEEIFKINNLIKWIKYSEHFLVVVLLVELNLE